MLSPTARSEETRTLLIGGDFPISGRMEVKVFQSLEDFYGGKTLATVQEPVTGKVVSVKLGALPEGRCLISVGHDANADGRMNSNAYGVPTEASTFYTPAPVAGPVRARDAVFTLGAPDKDLAVTLPPPPADPRSWGAGVMTLLSSNPYRGGDTVVRVLPLLTYVGERFYIVGPRAGFNLFKQRWFNLNATAEYKFIGDAFEDEDFLAGMDDRKDTLMAGLDGGIRGPGRWRLEVSALTDTLGRHDGQEVSLGLSRNIREKTWSVTPGAGLIWRSSKYTGYYFGVREDESTVERPAYDPGDSLDAYARVFARLDVNESWSLLASLRIEALSDDIQDSPIVDKDIVTSSFLGLNYAF